MSTTESLPQSPPLDTPAPDADVAKALAALQPGARVRKSTLFHEYYPQIEATLARGVTQVEVRAALKKAGLSLSAATFRKMLEAERQQNQTTPDEQAPSVAEDPPSSAFAEAGAI